MQAANADSSVNAITSSFIASVLFAIAVGAGEYFYTRTAHRNPSYRRSRLVVFVVLWVILNVLSFVGVVGVSGRPLVVWLTSFILGVVVFRDLNQFWQIGLVGADREVKGGLDYGAALDMCKHSLQFLGIRGVETDSKPEGFSGRY